MARRSRCAWMILTTALLAGCFSPDANDDDGDAAGATDAATGTGAADGTGGETSTTGVAAACENYCTLVDDHCADDLAQYDGTLQCEAVCAVMDPGQEGAVSGNTLGCRTVHAINAGEDPQTHCIHAGPAGGGVCGGECESFCSQALVLCTGDLAVWPDFEACATDCGQFATDPPYSSSVPDGDTFACRMHHLTLASLAPDTHCPHIALDSPVCR